MSPVSTKIYLSDISLELRWELASRCWAWRWFSVISGPLAWHWVDSVCALKNWEILHTSRIAFLGYILEEWQSEAVFAFTRSQAAAYLYQASVEEAGNTQDKNAKKYMSCTCCERMPSTFLVAQPYEVGSVDYLSFPNEETKVQRQLSSVSGITQLPSWDTQVSIIPLPAIPSGCVCDHVSHAGPSLGCFQTSERSEILECISHLWFCCTLGMPLNSRSRESSD